MREIEEMIRASVFDDYKRKGIVIGLSGGLDSADFYFCMPYDILDYILYGVENNVPKEEVAAVLDLSIEQIERAWKDLVRKREATRHLRELPPTTEF